MAMQKTRREGRRDDTWLGNEADLDALEASGLIARNGPLLHLGYAFGHRLGLARALTVEVHAPPEPAKAAPVLIPSILHTERCGFAIHDPDATLWEICSGWSARRGPTWHLDWSASGAHYPSFNFIARSVVPRDPKQQKVFLDRIAALMLAPPTPEGAHERDKDGHAKATKILGALCEYLLEDAGAGNTPGATQGTEPSLPATAELAQWLKRDVHAHATQMLNTASGKRHIAPWERAIEHLRTSSASEREAIAATLSAALRIFTRPSVIQRTRTSDFSPLALAGVPSHEALAIAGLEHQPRNAGEWDQIAEHGRLIDEMWEPAHVFAGAPNGAPEAFERLSALFFNVCATTLTTVEAGTRTAQGTLVGPLPTCFAINDFDRLARTPALIDTMDLGRTRGRFLLLAGALRTARERYTESERHVLDNGAALAIIRAGTSATDIERVCARTAPDARTRKRRTRTLTTALAGNSQVLMPREPPSTPLAVCAPGHLDDPILRTRAWNGGQGQGTGAYTPAPPRPAR